MWKTALLAAYTILAIIFVTLLAFGKLGWTKTVQPSPFDRSSTSKSDGLPRKELWYVKDLPSAAEAAWPKYNSVNGILGPDSEYLPLSCWYKPIRDLDPLYVYHHRINIVVVLNRKGDVEEGKYIHVSLSSYLPQTGDDGFVFSPNPSNGNTYTSYDVLDFKRNRGTMPDIQPANSLGQPKGRP